MSKTPIKGVHMSSEDRDLRGMKERRGSRSEDVLDEEVTSPHDVVALERERYEKDPQYREEMNAIIERYHNDPAFRALWNLSRRQRRDTNRTISRVADVATEVHHDVSQVVELGKKLQDISDWRREVDVILRIMKYVLGVVFVVAMGSLIVIATKIYTWGASSGNVEIRLQHIERALERRSNREPTFNFPAASTPAPANTTTRTP